MVKTYGLFALIAVLLIALAGVVFFWQPAPSDSHRPLELAAPPQGGDFTVNSASGPLRLQDLRGQVVLLYFGYTWCPDVCPTNLAAIARALGALAPAELPQVKTLFLSVDPERDTPERLKTYAEFFHPSMIGATASPAEMAALAKQYGVAYRKAESNSAMGYTVDHSAYTYLLDRQGRLRGQLQHAATPTQILEKIRALLAEP